MDYKIQFELSDATGWSQEFTSVRNLLKFLKKEYEFWDELHVTHSGNNGTQYLNFYNNLSEPINILEAILRDKDQVENEIDVKLKSIKQYFNRATQQWLYSQEAITEHYLAIARKENLTVANAFLDYVLNKSTGNISHQEHFKGYLKAYEFQNSDMDLIKRRDSEKRSLVRIRDTFQQSQDELFGEVETFKREFNDWEVKTKIDSERLYIVQKKLGVRKLKQQDKLFEEDLSTWKAKVQ